MPAPISLENVTNQVVNEGDAGIILKPDGTFRVFTTGAIDGDNLSPEQYRQGEILLALAIALRTPQVMAVLIGMSNDPDIVGEGVSLGDLN